MKLLQRDCSVFFDFFTWHLCGKCELQFDWQSGDNRASDRSATASHIHCIYRFLSHFLYVRLNAETTFFLRYIWISGRPKHPKGPKRTKKDRKRPKGPKRTEKRPKRTEKGPKRTEKNALVYYLSKRRRKVGDRQQNSRQGSFWGK